MTGQGNNRWKRSGKMPGKQKFRILEHVWIPMRDKIRLSARLWIPLQASRIPVPVVLEYIPYRKRDSYRNHDNAWGKELAGHGIAFARIDVRGTGDSEGVIRDEYTDSELDDGLQCIDWLSKQPWCNGSVGMRGISWGAINTLQIAALQPPSLKAIMSLAGTDNRFTDDAHYLGGMLGRPNLEWGVQFKAVMAAPPDPAVVGNVWEMMWRDRLEATSPIITEWLRHQWFDSYWQRGSLALDYNAIKCPAYLVGGWLDPYSNPVGRMLEGLRVPRKGLVGPWGHTYPETAKPGGVDWSYEEVRWWRHWLLGEDTDIMKEPMFRAFMPYLTARQALPNPIPGRWISEEVWPPDDCPVRKLWLNSTGLGREEKAMGVSVYRPGAPVGLTKPEWLNKLPIEQNLDDLHSLVFDSPPLKEDFEILGYPMINLRISASRTAASVAVRLTEVSPSGESWLVSYVQRNLTHRDTHTQPEPLVPDQFYDISMPMHMTAYRFKAGQQIRVAISDGLWPLTWPAPGRASLKIVTGVSSLELPARPVESQSQDLPMQQFSGMSARTPSAILAVEPDDQGWYVYENQQPPVRYTDPETGTTLTSESKEVSRIRPGSDENGSWRCDFRLGWQRKNWHCEIMADCELIASPGSFHIRETLKAYRDSRLIFEHSSDETVKRHLL